MSDSIEQLRGLLIGRTVTNVEMLSGNDAEVAALGIVFDGGQLEIGTVPSVEFDMALHFALHTVIVKRTVLKDGHWEVE